MIRHPIPPGLLNIEGRLYLENRIKYNEFLLKSRLNMEVLFKNDSIKLPEIFKHAPRGLKTFAASESWWRPCFSIPEVITTTRNSVFIFHYCVRFDCSMILFSLWEVKVMSDRSGMWLTDRIKTKLVLNVFWVGLID